MTTRTGYLTIFSPDRSEVYGEFADADWSPEVTDGESSTIFTATASDGALATFRRLDQDGISHVAYSFDSNGQIHSGSGELLAPINGDLYGQPLIRIETGDLFELH